MKAFFFLFLLFPLFSFGQSDSSRTTYYYIDGVKFYGMPDSSVGHTKYALMSGLPVVDYQTDPPQLNPALHSVREIEVIEGGIPINYGELSSGLIRISDDSLQIKLSMAEPPASSEPPETELAPFSLDDETPCKCLYETPEFLELSDVNPLVPETKNAMEPPTEPAELLDSIGSEIPRDDGDLCVSMLPADPDTTIEFVAPTGIKIQKEMGYKTPNAQNDTLRIRSRQSIILKREDIVRMPETRYRGCCFSSGYYVFRQEEPRVESYFSPHLLVGRSADQE